MFPGIDPLVVRKGDRVRIRIGNLTMTNHPIHLHGYDFEVTGTDGGWVPESARWPEVTIDVAGRARCARSSSWPTSRATGRSTATSRTTPWARWVTTSQHASASTRRHDRDKHHHARCRRLHADGRAGHGRDGGHGDDAAREHAADDDRRGPFGPIEMGGMFTVVKVRRGSPPATTAIPAGTSTRRAPSPTSGPATRCRRPGALRTESKPGKPPSSAAIDPRKRSRAANGGHGNH